MSISSVSQESLTFEAPESRGQSSRRLILAVNNATEEIVVGYSQAATPRVDSVDGAYPLIDGQLMLPSISAATLVLSGQGLSSGSLRDIQVSLFP